MKIGIISDTHDQIENIKKAVNIFKKEKVSLVYHLGDICSPFTLQLYKDLPCSIKAVFGNNDADIFLHQKWKPGNMEFFGRFYVDEFNGKKICLLHGESKEILEALFDSRQYDLILRGHFHKAEIRKNEKTTMINPGTLVESFPGNNHEWTKPSVAVYDFGKNTAKIIRL
jgi:uncharacterized protein